MEDNLLLRAPATAGAVNLCEGVAGAASEMVVCVMCKRSFKGQRSFSGHQRKAHPFECHELHQVSPRVKARWAPEESRRVAEQEATLILSGVKPGAGGIRRLVEMFPDRSYWSIKGERNKDSYQKLALDLALVGQVTEPLVPESSESTAPFHMDRDVWKVDMVASIQALIDQRSPPGEELPWNNLQVCLDSLSGGTSDPTYVKECLDHHAVLLTTLFPKTPQRPERKRRRNGRKFAKTGGEVRNETVAGLIETEAGPEGQSGKRIRNRKRKPNPARQARKAHTRGYRRPSGKTVRDALIWSWRENVGRRQRRWGWRNRRPFADPCSKLLRNPMTVRFHRLRWTGKSLILSALRRWRRLCVIQRIVHRVRTV